MASSGNPPQDDPPLPSWYRAPSQGGPDPEQPDPPPAEPEQPAEQPPAQPPGPVFQRPGDPAARVEPEEPPDTPVAEPQGDAAPLAVEGAAASGADEELPSWSRAREPQPPPEPAAPPAAPPTAVADAWTTQRDTPVAPSWARLAPRRDHPHVFGDRMSAGVLLTLATGSMVAGGIAALVVAGGGIDTTIRAGICGAVALVLLAAAVALRLVRGTDDLRGALAVTGIAYAAACLVFAYNPQPMTPHDALVKFTLAAGLVALLGWAAAIVVPSAVTGMIGVVALATAAGAAVWLAQDQPTHLQVFVAAIGVGLAVALVLPLLGVLRPHPTGLGWALGGAALVITVPAVVLISRQDAVAMAAGATASAALLALAQRHRNLPAALGAVAGLGYLEVLLVGRSTSSSDRGTQLVILVGVGVALLVLVCVAAVLQSRARPAPLPRRRLPAGLSELLLVAALALSIVALFTGGNDVQLNPNQLQPQQPASTAML